MSKGKSILLNFSFQSKLSIIAGYCTTCWRTMRKLCDQSEMLRTLLPYGWGWRWRIFSTWTRGTKCSQSMFGWIRFVQLFRFFDVQEQQKTAVSEVRVAQRTAPRGTAVRAGGRADRYLSIPECHATGHVCYVLRTSLAAFPCSEGC